MHVLLTRPEDDAKDLKPRIEALGCTVSVSPLIEIEFEPLKAEALASATSIVATSRNGLKSLARSSALAAALDVPIFVVGPATAALARKLGFTSIHEGAGTAADLVPLITAGTRDVTRKLVHLTGDHQAFDLAAAMKESGNNLSSVLAYRSVAAKTLDRDVVDLLTRGGPTAIVLMSPRTAQTWAELVLSLPRQPDFGETTHICFSPAVAEALAGLAGLRTEIASQPNSGEIVALVYRLAGRNKTG